MSPGAHCSTWQSFDNVSNRMPRTFPVRSRLSWVSDKPAGSGCRGFRLYHARDHSLASCSPWCSRTSSKVRAGGTRELSRWKAKAARVFHSRAADAVSVPAKPYRTFQVRRASRAVSVFGMVAEWLNASALKAADPSGPPGSNPGHPSESDLAIRCLPDSGSVSFSCNGSTDVLLLHYGMILTVKYRVPLSPQGQS